MWLYFFTLLLLVTNSETNTNEIIIDYFLYKKVSSVVGFHCGDTKCDGNSLKKYVLLYN